MSAANHLKDPRVKNALYGLLLVIFIVYPTIVIISIRQQNKVKSRHQEEINLNSCPDYWENVSNNENELKCKPANHLSSDSSGNLGIFESGKIQDFSTEPYKDNPEAKCRWAKKSGVSWEGIEDLCN